MKTWEGVSRQRLVCNRKWNERGEVTLAYLTHPQQALNAATASASDRALIRCIAFRDIKRQRLARVGGGDTGLERRAKPPKC
eukprot:1772129-Rhodomonas_salina.3